MIVTGAAANAPDAAAPAPAPAPGQEIAQRSNDIYVQVGAFGDRENAERRLALLSSSGITNAFVFEDVSTEPALLRVRIGPVADVIQYDILVEELEGIGIMDPYLVVE